MRIALVNNYWYLRGGAERVLFATKTLLEAQGHDVVMFGMKHPQNIVDQEHFADNNESPTAAHATQAIHNKQAAAAFGTFLDNTKPDLVHLHNIYHHLSFAIVAEAKKRKIPTVMTAHDYKLISPNYKLFHHGKTDLSMIGKRYYRCLLNNCMESYPRSIIATKEAYRRQRKGWRDMIDKIILPSRFMQDLFLNAGVDGSKIQIIENPIADPRQQPTDGKGITFVGRFSMEKGIRTLIDVVEKLPQYPFTVIGDGPLRSALEKSAHICNNLTLLDWQKPAAIQHHLSHARLVVVPSQWPEPFGLVAGEAALAGTLPIVTPVGALGQFVPPSCVAADTSAAALADRLSYWYDQSTNDRVDMITSIQERVAEATNPARYVHELIDLYEQLVETV